MTPTLSVLLTDCYLFVSLGDTTNTKAKEGMFKPSCILIKPRFVDSYL